MKFLISRGMVLLLTILLAACASAAPTQPQGTDFPTPAGTAGNPAFTFHREGGIAGFCDELTVYLTGEAFASSCAGQEPANPVRIQLTSDQLATLTEWVGSLQSFEFGQTDPATADALTILIEFNGTGERAYTEADIQAIQEMAQDLLAEAMPEPAL